MPKKIATIAAAAVLAVMTLTAACGGGGDDSPTPDISVAPIAQTGNTTPRARRTASPSPTPTASPLQVCAANPDAAPASLLQVLDPAPGAQVKIPVHVRGWSSAFEPGKTISLAVVDEKQRVVQINHLPAEPREYRVAPPGMDVNDKTFPFAADIILNDVTAPTPYCLWAYASVDDRGQPRQVVQIPVVFLPRG
jgi:hypothetical protein